METRYYPSVIPRPEFSQLYKFIAWVGIVLILAAAGLPVLVVQQESALLVTKTQLTDLTPEAATVLGERQDAIAFAQHAWPYGSFMLAAAGLVLLVWSLRTWKKRQDVFDKTEELNLEKLRGEVQAQTPSEIKDRALESAMEGGGADSLAEGRGDSTTPVAPVNRVLDVESRVFALLNEGLVPNYVGQPNAKLRTVGDLLFLDAVFRSLYGGRADIIVEIKYLTRQTGILMRLRNAVVRVAHACSVYREAFGTRAVGLIVLVVASSAEPSFNESTVKVRFHEASESVTADLTLLVIREEELRALDKAALRTRLEADSILSNFLA